MFRTSDPAAERAALALKDEMLDFVCGDLIGEGMSRKVYECALPPLSDTHVIKIELEPKAMFQNVLEWNLYNRLAETSAAKYLARCVAISDCGRILLQERTYPTTKFPKRLPTFLTDINRENFGMTLDGRFVCHDYALNLFFEKYADFRLAAVRWK